MASYEYDSQNQELNRIAGGTLYADCPIGSYIPFGGTAIPTGWLLCNGRAVSRTDYADLFAVIGTAYGSGDGSTTFNIPDMREAVPKGAGLTSKSNNHMDADGLAVGEFLDDRVQKVVGEISFGHTGVDLYGAVIQGGATGAFGGKGAKQGSFKVFDTPALDNYSSVEFDNSKVARAGATTEVKSVGSNYIIKAKQIGVPADFASAIEDVIDEKFSYSTSEVNTGKKWIDGKPIYRKVLPATLFTKDVQLNIQIGTNIEKGWVDFTHSYIYNTNGSFSGQRQPWNQTYTFVEGNNFYFKTEHSDFSNTTYIVAVVEYTKTTD